MNNKNEKHREMFGYTVIICNKETYLYEDDGRWFVEAKDIVG